jgi:Uma2 family endonuclease
MSTEKKPVTYEQVPEDPLMVEEPPIVYDLDITKRYTYAEYLTWFDDVRRELIDGFIYLMSAPVRVHALISQRVFRVVDRFIEKKKGKCHIYYAPFDVRLPKKDKTADDEVYNVVQPDICVVCDLSKLDDKGCIGAPDLMVEVLSPSTFKKDWTKKRDLYEEYGVREYWLVDPKDKTVHVFILQPNGKYNSGTKYEHYQKAPVYIFEGLEIDLKELFED